jgi:predicted transcriptional regulator with HTH domain
MKKSIYLLIAMVLLLNIFPTRIYASEKAPIIIENPKEVPIEVQAMFNRLEEIKALDKSKMNSIQKKEIRKEIKTIKSQLRTTNNGVYLSIGAIIIIILLLILIL